MASFIILSVIALLIIGIGVYSFAAKKPVSFFAGVFPSDITDVKRYNRSVAFLWFAYAIAIELIALPLLFLKQNDVLYHIFVYAGVIAISIALPIVYSLVILKKFSK